MAGLDKINQLQQEKENLQPLDTSNQDAAEGKVKAQSGGWKGGPEQKSWPEGARKLAHSIQEEWKTLHPEYKDNMIVVVMCQKEPLPSDERYKAELWTGVGETETKLLSSTPNGSDTIEEAVRALQAFVQPKV